MTGSSPSPPARTWSTATTFIGSSCSRISRLAATLASALRLRMRSSRRRSLVAGRARRRPGEAVGVLASTHCGAQTHSATSGPSSVGTSTRSPTAGGARPGRGSRAARSARTRPPSPRPRATYGRNRRTRAVSRTPVGQRSDSIMDSSARVGGDVASSASRAARIAASRRSDCSAVEPRASVSPSCASPRSPGPSMW